MFHERPKNLKISRLREQTLRIAYNHNVPAFRDLLNKDIKGTSTDI